MRNLKLILPLVVMLALVASFAYADEVVIDDAFTMHYMMEPQAEFYVWDPVMYQVDYTITGDPGTNYKAIIVVQSMGDKLREVERHKPGSYSTLFTNLARSDDEGTHSVNYTVKLKKAKTLVDVDTDTSQITVYP
jgi:hypothetical protein